MTTSKRKRPPDEDEIVPDSQEYEESVLEEVVLDLAHLSTAPVDAEAKPKRRRPDVTARHASNAGTAFSIVKTMLNSFYKEKAKALPWESVLKDMNKVVLEAYVLANIHVVRLCQANIPIEPLNNIFFYRCLSAAASGVQESRDCEQLKQSVVLYNE